jgi:hypothetical protein
MDWVWEARGFCVGHKAVDGAFQIMHRLALRTAVLRDGIPVLRDGIKVLGDGVGEGPSEPP